MNDMALICASVVLAFEIGLILGIIIMLEEDKEWCEMNKKLKKI
jgi:ABC-type methionine transport system permease subunit